jgi:hypothetical protein
MRQILKSKTKAKVAARAQLRTSQARQLLAEIDFEDTEDRDDFPEADSPEPQDIEGYGDSESALRGIDARTAFDFEWLSPEPLIHILPSRARPLVRYFIDEELVVHKLHSRTDEFSNLRYLIATAISKHLRNTQVTLRTIGDWCQIPAIESDENLVELMPEHRDTLTSALAHFGSDLKSFALMLPSGDVITPQVLIDLAQDVRKSKRRKMEPVGDAKPKKATRGGALRLSSSKPSELAGEAWSLHEWTAFEKTQRKKRKTSRGYSARRRRLANSRTS